MLDLRPLFPLLQLLPLQLLFLLRRTCSVPPGCSVARGSFLGGSTAQRSRMLQLEWSFDVSITLNRLCMRSLGLGGGVQEAPLGPSMSLPGE